MELLPGEKRGYWKYHAPEKWFRQAKIKGKLENYPAVLLLDSGAEVSIVDTTFAREVGCLIDTSRTQECVGIRDETYYTVGRTRLKVTLAGNLVYFFEAWVGDLAGQNAILGMDFMVPAGIRLDAGDGTVCLPDEVRVQMMGRRPLYGTGTRLITPTEPVRVDPYSDYDVRLQGSSCAKQTLWITRGKSWVITVVNGRSGRPTFLRVTNLGVVPVQLDTNAKLAMWVAKDQLPREYGFVRIGSRRYQEWQNLVYELGAENGATTESAAKNGDGRRSTCKYTGPMTERREYVQPKAILRRGDSPARVALTMAPSDRKHKGPTPSRERSSFNQADNSHSQSGQDEDSVKSVPPPEKRPSASAPVNSVEASTTAERPEPEHGRPGTDSNINPTLNNASAVYAAASPITESARGDVHDQPGKATMESADDEVFYHEGSDLFAEDMEREMAILLEVNLTIEVKMEDIKVGMPGTGSPEEDAKQQERLRRLIWRRRKW